MEEFRPIKDFENYAISNLGNVKNIKRNRILTSWEGKRGYKVTSLRRNTKKVDKTIHRLIAEAFIDNPAGKPDVDHIDNNKLNNSIANLRWCTTSENMRNAAIPRDNKSGAKGVSWDKSRGKWASAITVDHIKIYIGRYDTFEEAKAARVARARLIFGDFINKCETD